MPDETNHFPYRESLAAQMLADAIRVANAQGESVRSIGKRFGYKQAVVLSHMANGRVPIPVERAPALAAGLGLPPQMFLDAVLEQRFPEVDWHAHRLAAFAAAAEFGLVAELEQLAGRRLDDLDEDHRQVLREVVLARDPRRRWLSPHETVTVTLLRSLRPAIAVDGLSSTDRERLKAALA